MMAVTAAGCRIGFVQNRDSARLRSAITGRNKTDVIDADMLARCEDVLGVHDAPVPLLGQVGLRRALSRRHQMIVDAHRAECRLWSLLIWVMPDVWRAAGGHTIIQPLLGKWPDMRALSRARLDSITAIVAAHSRDRDPRKRAERIRETAHGWSQFWHGRLDLDDIAWEINELCDDITSVDHRARTVVSGCLDCSSNNPPVDPASSGMIEAAESVVEVDVECEHEPRGHTVEPDEECHVEQFDLGEVG